MGGHVGGDIAAKIAVKAFVGDLIASADPAAHLERALASANGAVRKAVAAARALEGMGSTLVAATVSGNRLRWISVGDSLLLVVRDGKPRRLNADHSMRPVLDDLVASGRLTAKDAAADPSRNALRSSVSGGDIEMIDAPSEDFVLEDGDIVLLATDGLATLSDAEIASIATTALPRGADSIVESLLGRVGDAKYEYQDNTTILAYVCAGGGSRQKAKRNGRTWLIVAAVVSLALALGLYAAWHTGAVIDIRKTLNLH